VTLISAVVVPSAPLLVPALAGGSAVLDADLRTTVRAAVAALTPGGDEPVVVVGAAPTSRRYAGVWDWRGFGLPARLPEQPRLPLGLALGDWLLDDAGASGPRELIGVDPAADAAACAEQGADLVAGRDLRLLVVGDGSARRSEKAPGHLDLRAEGYDDAAQRALGAGDPDALLALDVDLGEELLVAGRAPWQVMAGAAGGPALAELLWADAPYGVTYFVARWSSGPAGAAP
jgi:hypothetical protein